MLLPTDVTENMDVYVLDGAAFNRNKTLRILKRKFKYYTDQTKKTVACTGDSDINVASWAVSKTEDEAFKLALVYLINTLELNTEINNGNVSNAYNFIEENHADLIFKYTDNIITEC